MKIPFLIAALAIPLLALAAPSRAADNPTYIGLPDCRVAALEPSVQYVRWSGSCNNGYAEGRGTLTWSVGFTKSRTLEAQLVAGEVQGEATLTWPDGSSYIGTVKHGVPDGKGYFKDPDGMQYEGEVRDGRRDGLAEGLFPNGDNYKGEWKDGRPDGIGSMRYALGGAYEGAWKDGKRQGKGTLTFANSGRRWEGEFVADKRVDGAPLVSQGKYWLAKNLSLRYDQFTPEQKRYYNSAYPALEDGDEPPFPLNGLADIVKVVRAVQQTYRVEGAIDVYVLVDSQGKAITVRTTGRVTPEARHAIAVAAGIVPYKPALCAGQPCQGTTAVQYMLTWD